MKKPKMVLFDYGHTLLYEPEYNFSRGEEAVFEYITENPHNITPEQSNDFASKLFADFDRARQLGFEIHEWQALRTQYERLGLKFSLPMEELETVMWDAVSVGERMPNVAEMLAYLKGQGIRTGVISNIGWSGLALTRRINRLLPENEFEFIIASSEYAVRKPNPLLFEIALEKAGLDASEVWYCGDNIKADVLGSHGVGIFPVLYTCDSVEKSAWTANQDANPKFDFEFLHIHDWNEIVNILKIL